MPVAERPFIRRGGDHEFTQPKQMSAHLATRLIEARPPMNEERASRDHREPDFPPHDGCVILWR